MKDRKTLIKYSNKMQDVYENIEQYKQSRKFNILIIFDPMIADMLSNKKLNSIASELFIRGKIWNVSTVCITQTYFSVPKEVRLNSTHFFIVKIPTMPELQQIAFNHSCTTKTHSFLVTDSTLASGNHSRFRKNLLERILKLIMTIDDKIIDNNKEAERISTLSSGKIDKYEYLSGIEVLPHYQCRAIEQD